MPQTRAQKKQYHHGDLRHALVDAAIGLIGESGVESLTLRAAARRAGVSHAAPAHHFGDRAGLLASVAEVGFRELVSRMQDSVARHPRSPLEAFRAVGHAYARFAQERPDHLRVMFHPAIADRSPWPGLQEASAQALDVVIDQVKRCLNAGVIRTVEPRAAALTVWAAVHGLSLLIADDQLAAKGYTSLPESLVDSVLDDLFIGFRPGE